MKHTVPFQVNILYCYMLILNFVQLSDFSSWKKESVLLAYLFVVNVFKNVNVKTNNDFGNCVTLNKSNIEGKWKFEKEQINKSNVKAKWRRKLMLRKNQKSWCTWIDDIKLVGFAHDMTWYKCDKLTLQLICYHFCN